MNIYHHIHPRKKLTKKVTIEKFKKISKPSIKRNKVISIQLEKTIFIFIKHILLKILKIFSIQVPFQNYHIFC